MDDGVYALERRFDLLGVFNLGFKVRYALDLSPGEAAELVLVTQVLDAEASDQSARAGDQDLAFLVGHVRLPVRLRSFTSAEIRRVHADVQTGSGFHRRHGSALRLPKDGITRHRHGALPPRKGFPHPNPLPRRGEGANRYRRHGSVLRLSKDRVARQRHAALCEYSLRPVKSLCVERGQVKCRAPVRDARRR